MISIQKSMYPQMLQKVFVYPLHIFHFEDYCIIAFRSENGVNKASETKKYKRNENEQRTF